MPLQGIVQSGATGVAKKHPWGPVGPWGAKKNIFWDPLGGPGGPLFSLSGPYFPYYPPVWGAPPGNRWVDLVHLKALAQYTVWRPVSSTVSFT